METFSTLLALCVGNSPVNSPVTGEFPTQRPVMRSFDFFFDLRLNKWLCKQSWCGWFETPTCSLWGHRNDNIQRVVYLYLYPRPTKLEGGILYSPCPSVCPSVRPSVCRRHGFGSISQVCFGISISNFICMLMVAIGRSLWIFSDFTFKMAAWWPCWIFWFLDSNFTLALNINFKLKRHNTYVYG